MYEWTVREQVFVSSLTHDATVIRITSADHKKAVIARIPEWDSVGTIFFNEERWFAGFGQSHLRNMARVARDTGAEILIQRDVEVVKEIPDFICAPGVIPVNKHVVGDGS